MSVALPLTVNMQLLLANKSKGRVVKGIEQMRCRAVRFARGDGKFAANAATPLQYASAGDSPPTTLNIKNISFPSTKHMGLLFFTMLTGQLASGIEQMRCRAMTFARGYGKFAAKIAATPLQYASAGDSPPTTFTFFTLLVESIFYLSLIHI